MEPLVTTERDIRTIRELIDRMAILHGEDIFLIFPETGRVLTFAGLQEQSRAISALLRQAELSSGDKVAFLLDNGLFTAQLFLGTMYAGLVSVPLNVRAGASQLAYTLDHCDAKVVFVEDQYQPLIQEALAGVQRTVRVIHADVDRFAAESTVSLKEAPLLTLESEHEALLMYTSGSVGQPKGAMHSHRTLLAHGQNSLSSHQLTSADRSLLVLPIYHINAECVTLIPTLLSGGSVVVPHRFDVSRYWNWLEEYRCTWSAVVPTIISQLLDWKDPRVNRREESFQRIRFLRSSSAPLSPSLQREFLDKSKLLLIQAMGSSEAGNIFSNPLPPRENKIGTPGLAWGFETRIIDAEGREVPVGEPGEVLIRGPAVMQGYYKDSEATAAVLDAEGWMHTGDLAYQDQDGYFFVVGRSKELIIKAGMNIAPRQIDEVLESHPSVLEAAVVGVPDRHVGEDLVAFVVLRAEMEGDEREMLAFCETRLGHFKTPTRIHFVADLPKGPSGKVQRLRLLDRAGQLATAGSDFTNSNFARGALLAATSKIEQTIADCWAEVLKQPRVDPESNFFSLGGHSLMAMQCLSRLREKLPIALALSDFFENPTVVQQADLVRQRLCEIQLNGNRASSERLRLAAEQAPIQSVEAPQEVPPIEARGANLPYLLSSGQQRIWFFNELAPEVPLYNESEAVRLVGELQADALEQAFNLIIARHETLRATIRIVEERPTAFVHEVWPVQIKRIDLTSLTPAQRESEVARLLNDEPRQPYNLETEPGIRATLVRVAPTDHIFILMMHHLVCDWASEGVLWRELSSAYRAISRGGLPDMDSLPIQYGDYAVWQRQRVSSGFTEDLAFWEDNLRGAPELLELPSDRPRASVQSFRGSRQRFPLGANLTEALRNCSRREKTTLFTVFAAAFNTLLYRYTGSEDILLGIPLADRDRPELQSVIGFLLHTQVLRTQLSASMRFRELIARVQKGLLKLYSHREVPFEQVVSRIGLERNLSHSPLFQVMINWRDRDQQLSFIGLEGLAVGSLLAETSTSKFDLTLFITDGGDEIWLEAEYSTDLFNHDRIARMFGHYQTLLEAVAADPDQILAEIPILTDPERRKLLVEWNATEVTYPQDLCVHQLFELQVKETPNAIAVVVDDREVTYRELNQRSNQLAHYLRKTGIQVDDLVGICVDRSLDMMVGVLAILKAGGAYLPLDPAYPRERLGFILRDSRANVLLTQNDLRERLPDDCTIICLDSDRQKIAKEKNSNPSSELSADNLAYVIYTSGSTGKPKGVEIAHRSVVNLLSSTRKKPGMIATDTLLAVTTLSFDIAVLELFLPLIVGAKLVIAKRETLTDGDALHELLLTSGASIIQATPITFRMLIEAGWSASKTRLKVICGGEALHRTLADQILQRAAELWNGYGPTETTIYSSFAKVPARGPITIGKPIDNTQLYILDANGESCPIGRPGELYIGGAGLARGYLRQPELTAEKFVTAQIRNGPLVRLYKTGDWVRYLSDGSVQYLGRTDNQVKLRGFRIELGEIEAALKQHPRISDSVVAVQEDQAGDKRLVAYVVPLNQSGGLDVGELRGLLGQKVPQYMIPSTFVILKELPMNPNRKIDRKALPAAELGRASIESYVAPRTPVEHALAEIWAKTLGLKQVGVHDDFFDLGGHSLLAMRLIAEVRKSLDHKLPAALFFQNPTIAEMARALQPRDQRENEPQLIPLNSGNSAETLFFINPSMGVCRLARLLNAGPASFGTIVPLPSAVVEAATFDGKGHLPSMEDLAAWHVALIRTRQHSGPCLVAGHSFSGLLAFEVAHQLQRDGIPVEMVLLLDSWAEKPLQRRSLSLRYMWSRIRGKTAGGVARLASSARSNNSSSPGLELTDIRFGGASWSIVEKIYRHARRNYQLRKLESHAVVMQSQDSGVDPREWDGLFREMEIIETPGDHMSLLENPHVQVLAARINDRLEQRSEHVGRSRVVRLAELRSRRDHEPAPIVDQTK